MARKRNALNAKGRSGKSGRFVQLPHRILISQAYGSLDLTSRALLVELIMLHNGSNNGSLYLSVRDAADRLGVSSFHPVCRAFEHLCDRGLIQCTQEGHFHVKAADSARSRVWRLSWEAWPEGPRGRRAPDWSFEQWQLLGGDEKEQRAARRRAGKRMEAMKRWQKAKSENRLPVVKSSTMGSETMSEQGEAVVNITTRNCGNDGFEPFGGVVKSSTHVDVTTPIGVAGWWGRPEDCTWLAQAALFRLLAGQDNVRLAA